MECSVSSSKDRKDHLDKETLALLLKFLKIMENAAFLSKDNQVLGCDFYLSLSHICSVILERPFDVD